MALKFDPTSAQYLDCGNNNVLNIGAAFTFTAWIYPIEITTGAGDRRVIFDKGTKYIFRLADSGADPQLAYFLDGATGTFSRNASGSLSLNIWQFIALTFHNSAELKAYVNLVNTYSNNDIGTGAIDATVSNLLIGRQAGQLRDYDGEMEDVRIYNRKLSAEELQILYYQKGCDNIVNGLVGRWLMNEKKAGDTAAGANSVIDVSKEGNHGTPANSPVYKESLLRLVK